MAVVPTIRPDSVGLAALSGARAQRPQMQDGGLAQGLGNAGQALAGFAMMEDKRLTELDEATVRSLENEFATIEREMLWGTPDKPGALSAQGRDALVAIPQARTDLEVRRAEIAARAQGKRQQGMLARALDGRMASSMDALARREQSETTAWNQQEASSRIINAAEDAARAYGDPKTWGTKLAILDAAVLDRLDLSGMDNPETVEEKRREAFDVVAVSVTGGLLDTDPAAAVTFVETYGDRMTKGKRDQLLDAAKRADVTASSLAEADAVFAAAGDDYGRAITLLSARTDLTPQRRLAMEARLGTLRNMRITARADEAQATLTRLLPDVMAGGFDSLSFADREAAERLGIAGNLRAAGNGSATPANGQTYLNALQIMRTPAGRTFDLSAIAGDVTPAELVDLYKTQAAGFDRYQDSIEPGQNKVMARLEPLIEVAIPGKTPAARARTKAQAQAFVYGQLRIRVAANEDIDEAVITATVERAMTRVGTGYYFQTQTSTLGAAEYSRTFEALRGTLGRSPTRTEMEDFVTGEGKAIPFKKIPVPDRNAIIDQLRKDRPGKRVMEADVEAEYRAYLIGGE